MSRDDSVPNVSQVEDFRSPVPANFVAEMDRTRMTNLAVAQALGVSERQITRWRSGQVPRHQFVVRMAGVFDRDVTWFYADHSGAEAAA